MYFLIIYQLNSRITFGGVIVMQVSFNGSCGVISLKLCKQFMCNYIFLLNGLILYGILKH